jgi:hypothetical protein
MGWASRYQLIFAIGWWPRWRAGCLAGKLRRGLGSASPARSAGRACHGDTGDVRPKRQGGDKRSARIEAHAPVILGAVAEKPDLTLVELQMLLAEHRVAVAVSTLWRFFARRKITLKKSPRMQRSRTVPTS